MKLRELKRRYMAEGFKLGYKRFLKEFMDYKDGDGCIWVDGNNKDFQQIIQSLKKEFGVNVTKANGQDRLIITGFDSNVGYGFDKDIKEFIETEFGIRADVEGSRHSGKLSLRLQEF